VHARQIRLQAGAPVVTDGPYAETQEVLDFCAEHGIASDVQVIGVDGINAAYDELAAGDPGYRYVIDMSTLRP
jgi:uncharacterized zinc-type alcohol dehydrogenase-like protein